jgi:hypothetical protein
MARYLQPKVGIAALSALLCVAARPVSAAPPPESPVLQSLRALGLPAPDLYAPRLVTLDLGSINAPSFGQSFGLPTGEIQQMLDTALSYLGVPYRFGGSSPRTGFDCSGLVNHVFRQAFGLSLPRSAHEIARAGAAVARGDLMPGDLVFFNTRGFTHSHVGIYIGDSKFVHAPNSRGRVRIDDMDNTYYRARFDGARRIAPSEDGVEGLADIVTAESASLR